MIRILATLSTAFLTLFCVSATAQERIVPEVWSETYNSFHYAPAVRAGDMLYLSGVVASLLGDEQASNPDDLTAAFDRAFQSIEVVLKEAGASFADVVEMTTYHTELIPQIQTFTLSKDKWIKEPYPAWTAIDVDRLFPDRGLVEIKVIAYSPQNK